MPSSESLVPSIFPVLTQRMRLPWCAQPPFVRHLGICKWICQSSTTDVRCHYAQFSEKRSLHINKWFSYGQNIVFHGRHFGICNPICIKLFIGYVRCHSKQFKRKTASLSQIVFLRSTNAAYTHIHTRRWQKAKWNALHFA